MKRRKENRQSAWTPLPSNLVNFGPQTAENGWQVSAYSLKFARRTSCRLTFARYFGLIMAPMVDADAKSLVSFGEVAHRTGSRWALPCI